MNRVLEFFVQKRVRTLSFSSFVDLSSSALRLAYSTICFFLALSRSFSVLAILSYLVLRALLIAEHLRSVCSEVV